MAAASMSTSMDGSVKGSARREAHAHGIDSKKALQNSSGTT